MPTPFYQTQQVRDLAWLISSPMLIEQQPFPLSQHIEDYSNALNALDKNPEKLFKHLTTMRRELLGEYIEKLFSFWISELTPANIITQNIPIRDDKRTLTEIDFIIEIDNTLHHVEISTKFYLDYGHKNDLHRFIGPNATDSLQKRLDKFEKQLSYAQGDVAKQILSEHGADKPYQSHRFLKGWLFYPTEATTSAEETSLNPLHARGLWHRTDNLRDITDRYSHFILMKKPHWLSPVVGNEVINQTQLQEFANTMTHPTLIAMCEKQGKLYHEINRTFLMPSSWP